MKRMVLPSIALALVVAGCQQKPAAPVSEADATAAADATQLAWASMDLAKVLAVYAKDIVAFDPAAAPMAVDWATFEKFNQGFVDMKFDKIDVPDRKIQVLDGDTFVVSGTGKLTGSGPVKEADMRFTDVYQKQADGKWLIVNEHVSFMPKAPPE